MITAGYMILLSIIVVAAYGIIRSIFILRFRRKDGFRQEISKVISSTMVGMVVLGALASYAFLYL
ncbi:hypothetical protein [Lederbergia lenta]|uniref:hypothetical protein n=1 Tax=Lederbergia lenta TaxID=1467 RepID=UPI00203FB292|nr:hypothetical protein [Lederbergia lenta]MCM3113609.1 hypothetical protein [Lederbergia lenta]